MNCSQANQIPMEKVFESLSFFPSKNSKDGAFYLALNREEETPSLHLNFKTNKAHDFGTGKTYDNVSLVKTVKGHSVPEALEYLSKISFSFPKHNHSVKKVAFERKKEDWRIREIKSVQHPALINYMKKRRIFKQSRFLKEVHYTVSGKSYFGLGFENDSCGLEIRNKYAKVCLGKKDLSTIQKGSDKLCIFEGYFDYLSFLQIQEILEFDESDYLVLNSVSLINRIKNKFPDYKKIELFLDNDKAGNKATEALKNIWKNAKDNRLLYPNYKDLNEFVIALKTGK